MKYTFDYVNNFISDNNCILLDKEYFNCKQTLKIKCGCGNNIFETSFDNFVNKNKRQCNECSNIKKRISLEDAIIYCKQYAPEYKVLDIKLNKHKRTSIYVNCPFEDHQPYWVDWDRFKQGQRCKKCFHINQLNSHYKWDREDFINLLHDKGFIILDNNFIYNNRNDKVKCLDKEGYLFDISLKYLLKSQPSRFKKNVYAIDNLSILCTKHNLTLENGQKWNGFKNKYTAYYGKYKVSFTPEHLLAGYKPSIFHCKNIYTIENIKLYCKINNPEYQIVSTEYTSKLDNLLFKYIGDIKMLEEERYFDVNLHSFIFYKQGHPKFKKSKGEVIIRNWLIKNKLIYKKEFTFPDCKNILCLRFDYAIFSDVEKTNLICLIEYDGKQHFEEIEYFGGKDGLLYNQQNDKIKNEYCRNNNIKLIRIPYWEYKNTSNILDFNLLSA